MPPSPTFSWDVGLSGTATVAGQPVNAAVFLQGGKPAVIALDAILSIQISHLFDSFFGPIGLEWPSDIVDLTLTDTHIFYTKVPGTDFQSLSGLPQAILDQQDNVSGPGLFLTANISLELAEKNFAGSAFIRVIPDQGFSVTGTLSDQINFLDADFLYLTAPGSSSGGPTLSLQSFGTSQFTLNCGCKLFGQQLADAVLTLSTGSPELTAQLKSEGTIAPFSQPLELDFTWDRGTGLVIKKFPSLSLPHLPIDFTKLATLLSEASKAKGCGALKDLVLRDGLGIQTNFTVTPSLKSPDGTVAIFIEGYYKFAVLGRVVGLICFPPISFNLPSNLTFDGISDSLIDNIVRNAKLIIEALWDDKDALALILMIVMTKKAFENMISQLVCDELKDELEQLDDNWDPPPDPPPPSPSSPGSSGGGGGGGGAGPGINLGGLIGAASTAISITGKIGSTIGHIGSSIGSLLDGGDDDGSPPEPPATINATYSAATNELVVDWLSDPFMTYDVQLVDSTAHVLWETQVEANDDLLFHDPDSVSMSLVVVPLVSGVYTVRVRVKFVFTVTDWTTTTIVKLAQPANVIMSSGGTGELVRVQWPAVASATQYEVVVQDAVTNVVVASPTVSTAAAAGYTVTKDFLPGELGTQAAASYVATVTALAGDAAIPSETSAATAPLSKLAAPAPVTQAVLSGALRVTWTPVPNQTNYRIVVSHLETSKPAVNLKVARQTSGPAGLMQQDFSINAFAVKLPGHYEASVTALGDAAHIASSPTSSPTSTVLFSGIGNMQIGSTFTVS